MAKEAHSRHANDDTPCAFVALGLMSGTSMDGIDAAVVRTDGETFAEPLLHFHEAWDNDMRALVEAAIDEARDAPARAWRGAVMRAAEEAITEAHERLASRIMAFTDWDIGLVGMHGQTVLHAPDRGLTVQLGDGQALADACGVPVVWDMRANDMAHGGQGAPLAPAYHRLLARRLPMRPVAFVNIGGVANITWIGADDHDPVAFDTGPGNALLDDLMRERAGVDHDENGAIAARGRVDEDALHALLRHPFLSQPPPRAADRNAFRGDALRGLRLEDAAATLARFTARTIAHAADWLPEAPRVWIVSGGGRHNRAIMSMLAEEVEGAVVPAEAVELNGDFLEAECWAALAVRAMRGLPLTWPSTTGVERPVSGGVVSWPRA